MESTDKEVEIKKNIISKIRVPKEQREKIYNKIFKEFGIAILIFIYFFFLNLGYIRIESNLFKNDLYTFAGILVISSILLFERAYRKDNGEIALHGVELLLLATITLFMPYIYFYRGSKLKFLYSTLPIYISIYYLIKGFIIYKIEVKKYRDSLSDVKEILNDEETSYLDEENEKKFDESKLESEERVKKINTKNKINTMIKNNKKKVSNSKKNEETIEDTAKTTKKTQKAKEDEKEEPKKKEQVKKEKTTETKTKKKTTTTPKKRGRPRKNVKIEVKPLATAGRTKKKNGDNEND